MSARFRPIGFDAWRELQASASRGDELVTCPGCKGEGDRECCECGSERECGTCDGTGEVPWSELTDAQKRGLLSQSAYVAAVIADAQAFAGWLGRDPVEELVGAGFAVWSTLRSRQLCAAPAPGAAQ